MSKMKEYFDEINKNFKKAGLDYKIEYSEKTRPFRELTRGEQLAEMLDQAPLGFKV